jgi:hypothetical protein
VFLLTLRDQKRNENINMNRKFILLQECRACLHNDSRAQLHNNTCSDFRALIAQSTAAVGPGSVSEAVIILKHEGKRKMKTRRRSDLGPRARCFSHRNNKTSHALTRKPNPAPPNDRTRPTNPPATSPGDPSPPVDSRPRRRQRRATPTRLRDRRAG